MAIDFRQFRVWIVQPVINMLALPSPDQATDLLMSIAANESLGSKFLDQHVSHKDVPGPAFGPFQFERPTITLVNNAVAKGERSPKTSDDLKRSYRTFQTNFMLQPQTAEILHVHLDKAVAYARLLLWFDPSALPDVGNLKAQYDTYIRVWRPGKPPTLPTFKAKRDKWERGTL